MTRAQLIHENETLHALLMDASDILQFIVDHKHDECQDFGCILTAAYSCLTRISSAG